MRLADRLFAFWRPPAWTDPVQVLLWLLGWGVLLVFGCLLAAAFVPMVSGMLGFGSGLSGTFALVFVLAAVMMAGWAVLGCWFVSEAYNGWRAGHRHGRGWAIVIAAILLMNSVPVFWMDRDPGAVNLALRAVSASFALALLVACFTTKPPVPLQTTPS